MSKMILVSSDYKLPHIIILLGGILFFLSMFGIVGNFFEFFEKSLNWSILQYFFFWFILMISGIIIMAIGLAIDFKISARLKKKA